MKNLLAALLLALLVTGCKDTGPSPICPEYYASQVKFVTSQWKAGKLTTTVTNAKLSDLDERVKAWEDDHYVSDEQRQLIASASK